MKRSLLASVSILFGVCLGAMGGDAEVVPLPEAHAHNDYEHDRPLLDALDHGFCSIEADIWLVDDQLLVAHDLDKVSTDRTLQGLYLDPLLARSRTHNGRIYPDGPTIILLVDIKSDGPETYGKLREVLTEYDEMLTVFTDNSTEEKAVTVIISGNIPYEMILSESPRLAAADGRLQHLNSDANRHHIPLISDHWGRHFQWRGRGEMAADDREKLETILSTAHGRGQKVRFWALPRPPQAWPVLHEAGVNLLNADDLTALRDYLLSARE